MPIEFPCTECRQQVRTPDAAAGKKGKCPHCGAVMVIPGGKQPAPSSSPAPPIEKPKPTPKPAPKLPAAASLSPPPGGTKWRGDPNAAPEKPAPQPTPTPKKAAPAAAGPIEFPCPKCRGLVRTPQAAAGKNGKCPHCQTIVLIPAATPTPTPPAKKPAPAAPAPTPAKTTPAKTTPTKSAHAPGDSAALAAPRAHTISPKLAPPDGVDPNIGASYPLGSGLEPAEKKTQLHTPELAALDGLTPVASPSFSGLTPLPDSTGLTPLPAASGLTPLPSLGGLTPIGSEVSGLTPLGEAVDFSGAYSLPATAPTIMAAPPQGRTAADVRMMVLVPAIFQLLSTLPTIIYIFVQGAIAILALVAAAQLPGEAPNKLPVIVGASTGLFGLLVWLLAVLFVVKGSIDLMNRQSYISALLASLMSILLCTCGIGFPFGLWSLIVLCFADVRQAFSR